MPVWLVAFVSVYLAGLTSARAETLKIATYNVENYVAANRRTEAGYREGYPKPEAEKRALRTVIRALAADVLVMQEMGGQPYLDELRRDLKGEGLDYPYAALAEAADEDRHVAILARRPLVGVTTHKDLDFKYLGGRETVKRGLLEARIATAAGELTLFALHLKSRITERPDDPQSAVRRAAEATAIRDRVLKRFPTPAAARFVILGDLNDHRASKAATFIQARGKTAISVLLHGGDSRGEVWTHVYNREESYSRVDQIFVSPLLLPMVKDRAARVYDGEGVSAASDHRPVFAVLELEAGGK